MTLVLSTDLRVQRPGPSASVRDGRGSAAPFGPLFGPRDVAPGLAARIWNRAVPGFSRTASPSGV